MAFVMTTGCRTILGIDEDTPDRPVDVGPPVHEQDSGDASDPPVGACVPSCARRACGNDPTSGESCGSCSKSEACVENDAGAKCAATTIVWELDGVEVARSATYELDNAAKLTTLFVPTWGRSFQLALPDSATAGVFTTCPDPDSFKYVVLSTVDNSYTGLSALPSRWKDLLFIKCGATSEGDIVLVRDVTLTWSGPTRIAGTWEFVVKGAGPREGSTLRAYGAFDVSR